MVTIFMNRPFADLKAVDTFAVDIKQGDYIPDNFEPKDFSKAWRVAQIQPLYRHPFRKLTLKRDKMVISWTIANEDKVTVFPKPKQKKTLKSMFKRDLMKDFLWIWFAFSLATCAYILGKGL